MRAGRGADRRDRARVMFPSPPLARRGLGVGLSRTRCSDGFDVCQSGWRQPLPRPDHGAEPSGSPGRSPALSTLIDEDAMKTKLIASVAAIGFTTFGVTGLAFAQDNANRQSGNPATERMEKGNANEGAQRKMNERPAQTGQLAAPEKREGETRTGQNMQGEKREGETRTGQTPQGEKREGETRTGQTTAGREARRRDPNRPDHAGREARRRDPNRPDHAGREARRRDPNRPDHAGREARRRDPNRPDHRRAKSAKARPEPARPRKEGIAKARLPEARGTSASGATSTFPAKTPPAYQKIWSDRATARTSTSTSMLERRCRRT